jgi:hypothetical protein
MLFNYLFENSSDLLFGVAFAGTVGFIGFKFVSTYLNYFYVDKGIQTEAWEDYSDRLSQITSKSVNSIDTVTPRLSPIEYLNTGAQTISGDTSTVTTVSPIPPVNIEIIPNPELLIKADQVVQTIENPLFGKDWNFIIEYINNKPSFWFDAPCCDTWIIPDPSVLTAISNSPF